MDESKISARHFLLMVLHFYTITLTTIKVLFNKENSYHASGLFYLPHGPINHTFTFSSLALCVL